MDFEGIMLSEISQRKTNAIYDITYMWNIQNKSSEYNRKEINSQIQRIH